MSKVDDLLTRTRGVSDARRAANEAKYQDLVQRAARGEELNPDDLVRFLDAAGFAVEAFQGDVELLDARHGWKKAADALPARREARAKAAAKVEAIERDFQEQVERLRVKAQAANLVATEACHAADRLVAQSEEAVAELARTAGAAVAERRDQLARRQSVARNAVMKADAAVRDLNARIDQARNQAGSLYSGERLQSPVEVERLTSLIPDANQRLADARQRLADLDAEAVAVEAESLVP